MRLDNHILQKSSPVTSLAGSAPVSWFHHRLEIHKKHRKLTRIRCCFLRRIAVCQNFLQTFFLFKIFRKCVASCKIW